MADLAIRAAHARSSASSTRSSSRRCCCSSSSPCSRSSTCSPSRSPIRRGSPGMSGLTIMPDGLLARRLAAAAPASRRAARHPQLDLHHRRQRPLIGVVGTALMAWGLSRPGPAGPAHHLRPRARHHRLRAGHHPRLLPDEADGPARHLLVGDPLQGGQRLVPDHPRPLLRGDPGRAARGGRARRRQPVPDVLDASCCRWPSRRSRPSRCSTSSSTGTSSSGR